MDLRYEAFCFADPLFFDEQREIGGAVGDFANALKPPDAGWITVDHEARRVLRPEGRDLPAQGWKIHVSAGPDSMRRMLVQVHRYCREHKVAFKHLRSELVAAARNSEFGPRDGDARIATIYPADNNELARVLEDLSIILEGEYGPAIPGDLRFGAAPLYVRYGGFADQWIELDGDRVSAIRLPDGSLVPDNRQPVFSVPGWVKIPRCLRRGIAASEDPFPYRVTRSVRVSRADGVYLADPAAGGDPLVLKEARPDPVVDALGRLRREHQVLDLLAGLPGVPEVRERFTAGERDYLAVEYLHGVPLSRWLTRNHPLTRQDRVGVEAYTERALDIVAKVEQLVAQVHERGVVLGDLRPQTVLVQEDSVSLIGFEQAVGAPGFRAPADRTGIEIDQYALAALRLWIFLPLVGLLELAPARLRGIADAVQRRFALPEGYVDTAVAVLAPREAPAEPAPVHTAIDEDEPDWTSVRRQVAMAILATATPRRADRLFPGDVEQFRVGGACFGVGAAGVLHALDVTGAGRFPEYEQWLIDAVRREPPARPGFYDGSHGIAYVLENFGHREAASKLLTASARLVAQTTDHTLGSGLAGIGLTQLHFAVSRRDNEFGRQALQIAIRLVEALETAAPPGSFGRAGLLSGWSGPALLFIRLFERTGEDAWLAFADQALLRDLEECTLARDGSLQVRAGGPRMSPHMGIGSAGILMVAEQLARHRPDATACESRPGLRAACLRELVRDPGLLNGRCGLAVALGMGVAPDQRIRDAIELHLTRLAWHAVPLRGGLAFPGRRLLRLSMDVHTGGAGVLLALAALRDGREVLPFVGGGGPGARGTTDARRVAAAAN